MMMIVAVLATLINAVKQSKIETDLFSLPSYEVLINSSLRIEDFAPSSGTSLPGDSPGKLGLYANNVMEPLITDFKVLSMGSRWNCLVPTINDSEDSANKDSLTAPPNPFEVAARLNGIQCLYQIRMYLSLFGARTQDVECLMSFQSLML